MSAHKWEMFTSVLAILKDEYGRDEILGTLLAVLIEEYGQGDVLATIPTICLVSCDCASCRRDFWEKQAANSRRDEEEFYSRISRGLAVAEGRGRCL